MSKEHPILFTGDMVRAILDGRKTQTRRVIKNPQRLEGLMLEGEAGEWCPYGVVGDRLYVRETWCAGIEWDDEKPSEIDPLCGGNDIFYLANGEKPEGYGKTRPNIFMPKWAARIWLEITGIRVERVQEITQDDIRAEGLWNYSEEYRNEICMWRDSVYGIQQTGLKWWKILWDSINAKRGYGWDVNPWVWVVEFKRVRQYPK